MSLFHNFLGILSDGKATVYCKLSVNDMITIQNKLSLLLYITSDITPWHCVQKLII